MTSKKRFGISVPAGIATELESIATKDGVDRSRLVSIALSEYLHREKHVSKEHKCSGVLIVHGLLRHDHLADHAWSVVKSIHSVKLSEGYITILIVEGSYREILNLREEIAEKARKHTYVTEYIPVYCVFARKSDHSDSL